MRELRVLLVAMLLATGLTAPAHAAPGKALGVDKDARAEAASEEVRVLEVGSDIFIGDRVVTDDRGLVQIRFSDRTELVVGPRSSLLIEDYLLREDGSAGRLAVNALAGTFRFVTGGAPKDRYLVKTPTGTIGVRGTAFDFNVGEAQTSLLLFHGEVVMCNTGKQCITVTGQCGVGVFDTGRAELLGGARQFDKALRNALRGVFPYAVSESKLLGSFRIEGARDCLVPPSTPGAPESLNVDDKSTPTPRPPHDNWLVNHLP